MNKVKVKQIMMNIIMGQITVLFILVIIKIDIVIAGKEQLLEGKSINERIVHAEERERSLLYLLYL